ncbi:PREDICTED: centrosome-associated zinc finger protein CP190 [Nicrophorus vespilloides]|uniref:Centrosome-associated zinc finger protein CP190 n=1 Tax=Nicrophorus vespilloides TaxID=110193 RepID=A0ABM1NK13_NICVS|nr:PREDICTED: centrosome-associated zinc finger protein CP190 [Nicrophorus vespilloides]XP_017787163.1 PREDICTED: centrosome-associated zinc finger protein CP190 [Nicrophorus vespilloides]XP_017787172.1 PREDICTED: centrosome-associated zinc finger protein CP190 [Nicrophorus vespilloides]
MGEVSKQVRVDNWGIYFLSRLQVFFNKTDYCDLTLQFEGNVQLKVHRLVMNACTEYFQVLEQTCEVNEDVLLMPSDLQADVILPIVNFIYTGMLEYELILYEKLYKTAELMNITVLLKLLDAQKQPTLPGSKAVISKVPPVYNLQGKKITPKTQEKSLPPTLPGRKLPVWKRKTIPSQSTVTKPTSSFIPSETKRISTIEPINSFDNAPKPTRFEWPEEDFQNFNLLDTAFDSISYNSKPLLTQEDEMKASTSFSKEEYSAVNLDELKNYVKEQKIRNDIEYEEYVDNDLDPDYVPEVPVKRKKENAAGQPAVKKVRFNVNEKENKETKINITPTGKGDVDHSKIISEVLKKYPHLMKKNKNIRLKILPQGKSSETMVKSSQPKLRVQMKAPKVTVAISSPPTTVPTTSSISSSSSSSISKQNAEHKEDGPWICTKCSMEGAEQVEFVLYYLYRKHMTDVHHEKFDSKMCKYCGHQFVKQNLLMYHQLTKHSVKPPAGYEFPKCQQCPYTALSDAHLEKHKLIHTNYEFQCKVCKVCFNSDTSLKQHTQITGHSAMAGRLNYDCQYCTKNFQTAGHLFIHLRSAHREEAERDGIVSLDDDEDFTEEVPSNNKTVKVLDNIKLKGNNAPADDQNFLKNTGIATNLGLVDIVVLDDNQQYILHPNSQQIVTQQSLGNNQEFMLPDLQDTYVQNPSLNHQVITTSQHNVITQSMLNNTDIASTDELVMVLTDHDYNDGNNEILSNDNSNIVVLYSHPVEGQNNQFITSQSNIMLNSETGMLEISNLPTNATAESLDNQNTVESIEMIQREIESHNNQEQQLKAIENSKQAAVQQQIVETATAMEVVEETPTQELIKNIEESQLEEQQQQQQEQQEQITTEQVAEVLVAKEPESKLQEEIVSQVDEIIAESENPESSEKSVENQSQDNEEDDKPKQIVELVEEIVEEEDVGKIKQLEEMEVEENKAEEDQPLTDEIEAMEVDGNEGNAVKEEPVESINEPSTPETTDTKVEDDDVKNDSELKDEEESSVLVEESNSTTEVSTATEVSNEEADALSQDEDSQKAVDEDETKLQENQSQAAKMSILDDWEDTDSQQSEHGKSQSTVNKLINDWDD